MADLEKTVSIVFKGVDEVSKTIDAVGGKMESFGKSIESATQPLADIAETVLKAEAALAAMATGGLALAVKEAGAFNASFNEISTLTNATGEDLEAFRKQIVDYATISTASFEDINGAVYAAISAGVDYKNSVEFVAAAEKLAAAGKADLNATTVALVSTLNAYGESTDQAGKYSDIFFSTVKLGQTTLPELSQSLSQVTAIAASAGVPFETVAAAIAALTAQGAPTSEAITRIKSAIVAFIKPSAEATEAASQLGIEFGVTALKSKGFEEILAEIYTKTGGNAEKMAEFFGRVEGLNAALVLGADKGGKFAAALEEMKSSAGATDAAFAKMSENMGLVFQNLLNNLKAVLIDIGTPLLDDVNDIAAGIVDIFQGIRVSIDAGAFDPVFASIEKFAQALADDLKAIGAVLPEALENVDFTGLVASIENLGGELTDLFSALFGDVDLTTAEGLASAIQRIVDAATGLTNIASGIVKEWTPVAGWLSDLAANFTSADEETQKFAGTVLGLGQVINTFAPALSGLGSGLGIVADMLTALAAIKYTGIATGIASMASAMAPFAIGGAIGLGIGYIISELPAIKFGVDEIPEKKEILIALDDGSVIDVIEGIVRDLEGNKITLSAYLDPSGLLDGIPDNTPKVIKELLETGESEALINFVAQPDTANLEAAIKEAGGIIIKGFDEAAAKGLEFTSALENLQIEPLELIDVDQSLDAIEEIKQEGETLRTALEWTAKVNIAEAEASAEILKSSFEASADIVDSLAGSLAGLFGAFDKDMAPKQRWLLQDAIEQQLDLEKKAVESQLAKDEQLTKWLEAKTKALERGEALIKIEAPGLQPHLEAFMWEILEAIQVRASEEGAEFLLGI